MSDTTITEPYDLEWLAPDGRIREIITRYNNPDSAQRRMLATFDLMSDRARELEAIVRDLAAQSPSIGGAVQVWCKYCDREFRLGAGYVTTVGDAAGHKPACPWRKSVEWVSAHPVSGTEGT